MRNASSQINTTFLPDVDEGVTDVIGVSIHSANFKSEAEASEELSTLFSSTCIGSSSELAAIKTSEEGWSSEQL